MEVLHLDLRPAWVLPLSTYGGMAIMADELTLAYHHPFARGKNVFIVIPPVIFHLLGPRSLTSS